MKYSIRGVLAFVFLVLVACATPTIVEEPTEDPSPPPTASPLSAEIDSYELFRGLSPVELWHVLDELAFDEVPLNPPADYYSAIDGTDPDLMREQLHRRIRDHVVFPYTDKPSTKPGDPDHRVDTWDIIALADAHPEDPDLVLDIYLNATFERQLSGTSYDPRYNREHSWPKILGFDAKRMSNPPYSDVHHLFAAYNRYNSSRYDKPYGVGEIEEGIRKPTHENLGRGGELTEEPGSSNYRFPEFWQTWIGRRGDVARAMFYMDIRYEGNLYGSEGEPNLELTDDLDSIDSADVWRTGGVAFMGLLSTLVRWHKEDPVDDIERRRNTVVFLFQGNRNPFIDHPNWIELIYEL
jgi:endonuclease I